MWLTTVDKWDLIIAHPPCTFLSCVNTRGHSLKKTPKNRIIGNTINRIKAMKFFMACVTANCDKIAVENPVGIMNTAYRKPDQIIEPYMWAKSERDTENYVTKRTCLWLKGLPKLKGNEMKRPDNTKMFGRKPKGGAYTWEEKTHGSKNRSKTFPGIARAMAEQWG